MFVTQKIILFLGIVVVLLASLFWILDKPKENKGFVYTLEPISLSGVLHITSPVLTSQQMLDGILCAQHAGEISQIDLFMPDMGHGSQPPVVTRLEHIPSEFLGRSLSQKDFGCYLVTQMQLYMPGLWQVRVLYKDKTTVGTFSIVIPD